MILVIAGKSDVRAGLICLIAEKGYEVSGIDCDDEIWKIVQFRRPVLVVIDCAIDANFKVLSRIRSDSLACSIPVVMFSVDDQNLREIALLKGADAYVPKGSLDWAELLTEIRRLAGTPASKGETA